METLFKSAIESSKRTSVTTLFAQHGFKIAMTDFDDVVFEKDNIKVCAHFDFDSNLTSVQVLPK
ncbi:hypothetical protein NM22_08845 [Vibrio tubiashii]|nr:hypothetical protein NM22_08845 [Vibrio tubiashii]